ncbi:GNAT family N-acetyltransferase [Marinicrinis lubricantis]|uniref:GNAT family N-acetyltransferase n=1 Tax=Marinicrinis lubricantis TaxID=2086470 RepID=A0ABW1IPY2_9BACL
MAFTWVEASQKPVFLEEIIQFFWNAWGTRDNYLFYKDCIEHSLDSSIDLPKFYLLLEDGEIIGSYALLINDLISRQDLFPWLACLYVRPEARGHRVGEQMLNHACEEAKKKGYSHLYLCSTLEGYYEKAGWNFFGNGYGVDGTHTKIYAKAIGGGWE